MFRQMLENYRTSLKKTKWRLLCLLLTAGISASCATAYRSGELPPETSRKDCAEKSVNEIFWGNLGLVVLFPVGMAVDYADDYMWDYSGCGTIRKIVLIEKGMDKNQVVKILGEPEIARETGRGERMTYSVTDWNKYAHRETEIKYHVVLSDEKVDYLIRELVQVPPTEEERKIAARNDSRQNLTLLYGAGTGYVNNTRSSDNGATANIAGLDYDYKKKSWPVYIHAGVSNMYGLATSTPTSTVNASITEADVGLRHYFRDDRIFRPFLSAGIDTMTVSASCTNSSACNNVTGTSVGFFADGGFLWSFPSGFDMGFTFAKIAQSGNSAIVANTIFLGLSW